MPVNPDARHTGPGRTQEERSATTRAALLAAGRALFTEHGFQGAGREDIAEHAGVTRGALYHHFASKLDLFRAVVEALEEELVGRVTDAAKEGETAADHLRLGAHALLDAATDPAVRRILLLDAPSVLGWETWREIEARYGLGMIEMVLTAAMDEKAITRQPVAPLAQVLLAALQEASLYVATSANPRIARREVGATIDHLISRL
jgi:AcrR family transcriptional regulator